MSRPDPGCGAAAAMLPLRQASPGDEPLDTRSMRLPVGKCGMDVSHSRADRCGCAALRWIPSDRGSRPVRGYSGQRLSERLGLVWASAWLTANVRSERQQPWRRPRWQPVGRTSSSAPMRLMSTAALAANVVSISEFAW
jgi:hypothetical protein